MANKTFTKVTAIKTMSRATFGQVKPVSYIPNKKLKRPKYPHKFEE
jgi:hypothetical protein